MKKLVYLFLLSLSCATLCAGGPSDLVLIDNPNVSPGEDKVEDFCFEFFDITGKKVYLEYSYDPLTKKIMVKGGTGTLILSVTNKKTAEKKTQKVVFVSGS